MRPQPPHLTLSPSVGEDKGEWERCQNFETYFRDTTLALGCALLDQ
jgi:hypothetical protein